jgi:DNA-directed RNA polymerase subunit RPC12/RpoP
MAKKNKFPHWIWPLGLAMAGAGSVAAVVLRGCWHKNISWPLRYDEEFSYIVCTNCGVKRLFDEKMFQEYGPYGYDIEELIAKQRERQTARVRQHEKKVKTAAAPGQSEAGKAWSPEI